MEVKVLEVDERSSRSVWCTLLEKPEGWDEEQERRRKERGGVVIVVECGDRGRRRGGVVMAVGNGALAEACDGEPSFRRSMNDLFGVEASASAPSAIARQLAKRWEAEEVEHRSLSLISLFAVWVKPPMLWVRKCML